MRACRFCSAWTILYSWLLVSWRDADLHRRCNNFLLTVAWCLYRKFAMGPTWPSPAKFTSIGKLAGLVSTAHNLLIVTWCWSLFTGSCTRRIDESRLARHGHLVTIFVTGGKWTLLGELMGLLSIGYFVILRKFRIMMVPFFEWAAFALVRIFWLTSKQLLHLLWVLWKFILIGKTALCLPIWSSIDGPRGFDRSWYFAMVCRVLWRISKFTPIAIHRQSLFFLISGRATVFILHLGCLVKLVAITIQVFLSVLLKWIQIRV